MSSHALSEIWEPLGIKIVDLPGDHKCIAIVNPGKRLTKKTFDDLYEILQKLWQYVTGDEMKQFWNKKKKARFLEGLEELYLITNKQDQIIGFNGWFLTGDPKHINIYVDLMGKLPDVQEEVDFGLKFLQKTIIERAFARFERWKGKPIFVTTRTQSPVVYLLAQEMVDGLLYPHPTKKTPANMHKCAEAIANKLGIEKEEVKVNGVKQKKQLKDDLIWKDAYDPPLYNRLSDSPPKDKTFEKIDKFFKDKLGEKDAFILVGIADISKVKTPTDKGSVRYGVSTTKRLRPRQSRGAALSLPAPTGS
jgi:hypothetical protein